MPKLTWDKIGERLYETGVNNGVLFVYDTAAKKYGNGVAWNGITAVNESPSGADESALYADNIKYLSLRAVEKFGATIEAYTYPDEFAECDGSAEIVDGVSIGQQTRKMFAFSYKTTLGSDTEGDAHGYKIHIVYGATAAPSSKSYQTVNESPEAITLSWEVSTVPVDVTGHKPTASIVIDSTKVSPTVLKSIEDALYGSESGDSKLLMPDEIIALVG